MAITKIWAVKHRLDVVVDYVKNTDKTENPEYGDSFYDDLNSVMNYTTQDYKTEQKLYVSGVNVDPATATECMLATAEGAKHGSTIVAFHGVQSFAPDEVTPETAHEIGVRLAQELWGDRHEVVVATHLDKGHLHNHFVVNAVSFIDGKRFPASKATYRAMRECSDRLCKEYSLSVIRDPKRKGHRNTTWDAASSRRCMKCTIRQDINAVIKESYTMDEFFTRMRHLGYQFRLEGKYPSVLAPDAKRWRRLYKLGTSYELDSIEARIHQPKQKTQTQKQYCPIRFNKKYPASIGRMLFPGIRARYYRLLYALGELPKHRKKPRVKTDRSIIRRVDALSKELRLLTRYQISTTLELEELEQRLRQKSKDNADALIELRTVKRIKRRLREPHPEQQK